MRDCTGIVRASRRLVPRLLSMRTLCFAAHKPPHAEEARLGRLEARTTDVPLHA
jgi:hypothetical protein